MKKMWKGGVLFVLCVLCLYTANEAKATSKTSDEAINWVKSQVGNSIDADGAYGAQCVDLIRAYYNFLELHKLEEMDAIMQRINFRADGQG